MATVTEQELIAQAVLDYYEGWFDGDAGRMDRALHPDLVKRRAGEELGITTKERMLELTRRGEGKDTHETPCQGWTAPASPFAPPGALKGPASSAPASCRPGAAPAPRTPTSRAPSA